jgi:hypothetical protein
MTTTTHNPIKFDRQKLSDETLLHLYKILAKPRIIDTFAVMQGIKMVFGHWSRSHFGWLCRRTFAR